MENLPMTFNSVLFLASLSFILPFTANGQSPKQTAQQQVFDLKQGVLLIQLRDHSAYRQRLVELGETEKAKKNEEFEDQINIALKEDFNSNYDFSPFYYFYSSNNDHIKNGEYEGYLLDKNLAPVGKQELDEQHFKNIFFVGIRNPDTDSAQRTGSKESIVMMDKDFNQVRHPFPAASDGGLHLIHKMVWQKRAKTYGQREKWVNERYGYSIAEIWNMKLHTYYNYYVENGK